MQFDQDIMISYAWRDNQAPPFTKQEGWVSGFQQGLEYWLKQIMPRPVKVWRDKNQMPGNKLFANELDDVVGKSAILLAVMSEPYLSSEWCGRELENFLTNAKEQGGLEIDNNYRIFKINKLPVGRDEVPEYLDVVTGFDFYELETESRLPKPIDPSLGDDEKQKFIRKIYDVAVSIATLLKAMDEKELSPVKAPSPGEKKEEEPVGGEKSGLTFYLPHTTRELRGFRDEIVSELIRRNCTVLPSEKASFMEAEELISAATADLSKCDFAVHLLGSRYGLVPEGADESVTALQINLSAKESKSRGINRLICIPEEAGEPVTQQAELIKGLHRNRDALERADLIEGSGELLKAQIFDLMKSGPPKGDTGNDDGTMVIYLLHEESDKKSIREIRKFLKPLQINGKSLKVVLPLFDGDAGAIRERQQETLKECDAVILFWGNGSQAWIESSLNVVRKSPAFGRTKKFQFSHLVYLAGEKTSAKEDWWLDFKDDLLEEDVFTLNALETPAIQDLEKFIKGIK